MWLWVLINYLGKGVKFRDLGLLVVDEEQRFGVNQKEKIKSLKTQVDVLTLTATPIPRTLYMSLSGVREMSLITTPPPSRRPIKTHLIPYNPRSGTHCHSQRTRSGGTDILCRSAVSKVLKKSLGGCEKWYQGQNCDRSRSNAGRGTRSDDAYFQ